MKAIRVQQFGAPEVLKIEEVAKPVPASGQVLVRVHAVGVNPYEAAQRAGTYAVKPSLPYTPGSDAAGVVDAVGPSVTKVKAGDRVYTGRTVSGSYAEYTLALESQVHLLPDKISYAQGAAVWVPCGTAYHALYHSAKAHASETLLVHGASGGVGSAAVQLAHAMGLTVFGTASSEKGREMVKREGARQVFDHSKAGYQDEIMQATAGRGVDIIIEMLANVNLAADLKLLATNGRVIVVGNRGEITINPRDLMSRRASIRAFTLWAITEGEEADMHAGMFAAMENGTLRPVVGKQIPLAEAARAHKEIMEPGAAGKIVLIP
ncbi:MAG TPA: NADPH:quinone reductase [Candidatus Dormibacteraeota bacterium]|nr:NADPH:quinone reductase [Candidatus Dormibacteraeota bacterium]